MSRASIDVVILDVASECNRGDAVMQEAMVDIARDSFPSSRLTAIAVYGDNQASHFPSHFDATAHLYDQLLPGARPTFVNLGGGGISTARSRLRNALLLLWTFVLQVAAVVRLIRPLLRLSTRGRPVVRNTEVLESAKVVIWNGRNFRDRRGLGELYDTIAMTLPLIPAFAAGVPVVALGVSVWKLRNPISRHVLALALSRCHTVTARERFTMDRIAELAPPGRIQYCYLPDLSVLRLAGKGKSANREMSKRLAVTVTEWDESGQEARENYERAMADAISYAVESLGFAEVVFSSQIVEPWESSAATTERISALVTKRARDAIRIERGRPSVEQLVELYASCDLLLSTRMHSSIFAASAGTPAVSVAYDAGAKWRILDEIGNGRWVVDYTDVSGLGLIALMRDAISSREEFRESAPRSIEAMRDDAQERLRKILGQIAG